MRAITMTATDYTMSLLFIGLILEAVRRTVGASLVWLILFGLFYALYADWFPDPFFGPPVPVQRVRKTAAAPAHKRLLGGGGAGGGAFCFAELFADLDLG